MIGLFFCALSDRDDALVEFGIGGLCNLISGGNFVIDFVLKTDDSQGCCAIISLLARPWDSYRNRSIILSALSCLTYLARHSKTLALIKLHSKELLLYLSKLQKVEDYSKPLKNHISLLTQSISV